MPPIKVVYLFGAGATMAEASVNGLEKPLSLVQISEAVMKKAKKLKTTKEIFRDVSESSEIDIEHYISLLETLRTRKYDIAAETLRSLFCETVEANLVKDDTQIEPTLEMALLQMHKSIRENEE